MLQRVTNNYLSVIPISRRQFPYQIYAQQVPTAIHEARIFRFEADEANAGSCDSLR